MGSIKASKKAVIEAFEMAGLEATITVTDRGAIIFELPDGTNGNFKIPAGGRLPDTPKARINFVKAQVSNSRHAM